MVSIVAAQRASPGGNPPGAGSPEKDAAVCVRTGVPEERSRSRLRDGDPGRFFGLCSVGMVNSPRRLQ